MLLLTGYHSLMAKFKWPKNIYFHGGDVKLINGINPCIISYKY